MASNRAHYSTSGVVALVGLAFVYGLSTSIARYLSGGLGLFEQWYLRFAIGFLVGAVVFYRNIAWRKFLHLPKKEWTVLLFRVLVGQVIAIGLYTFAVQRTKLGLIAFMEVLPMSSVVGLILFRESLSRRRALLMVLSFLGAVVVVVNSASDLLNINFGALIMLIGLVFYALMLVTRRWHTGVLNNQEISVALTGVSCIMTYGLSLLLYHRWIIPVSHWNWRFTMILAVAGCLSIASNFLSNYGFEHVSAVIAGNILSLEEFFGPLFGFLFYRELLSGREIIGGLIILVSVILTNQVARREHRAALAAIAPG